jgi:hypothetical protein
MDVAKAKLLEDSKAVTDAGMALYMKLQRE